MSEARVKAKLWVQMALRLGAGAGRPGVVVRSGDPDAGGILVMLRGRAGTVVLSQVRSGSGEAAWMRGTGATPVEEARADAYYRPAGRLRSRFMGDRVRIPGLPAAIRGQDRLMRRDRVLPVRVSRMLITVA